MQFVRGSTVLHFICILWYNSFRLFVKHSAMRLLTRDTYVPPSFCNTLLFFKITFDRNTNGTPQWSTKCGNPSYEIPTVWTLWTDPKTNDNKPVLQVELVMFTATTWNMLSINCDCIKLHTSFILRNMNTNCDLHNFPCLLNRHNCVPCSLFKFHKSILQKKNFINSLQKIWWIIKGPK